MNVLYPVGYLIFGLYRLFLLLKCIYICNIYIYICGKRNIFYCRNKVFVTVSFVFNFLGFQKSFYTIKSNLKGFPNSLIFIPLNKY